MFVTSVSGVPGGGTAGHDVARGQGRHAQARQPRAQAGNAPDDAPETGLFDRWALGYAGERFGQPIAVLLAGAITAAGDLGAAGLRAAGADLTVGLVDDDQPVTQAARGSHPGLARCLLGDLRTVPLPQRSFDIVQATLLLERIEHAELVLDRLVGALKPGGLLCLQVRDRDCAGGFLDRVLPGWTRRMIWRKHRPGRPGPHPAVYERVASARGVQSYALMRGLVIAAQQPLGGLAGGLRPAPRGYLAAQKAVAALSRGRLTAAHEEVLYVMRKPENRFARIL